MEQKVMDLKRAKLNVDFPELAQIFIWQSWICYTDIEYEALAYLVKNSSRIMLSNIVELSKAKKELLNDYKGYLEIGIN